MGCVIMAPLASQGLGLLQGQQDEPVQMAPGVLALLGDLAGDVRREEEGPEQAVGTRPLCSGVYWNLLSLKPQS